MEKVEEEKQILKCNENTNSIMFENLICQVCVLQQKAK